MANPPLRTAWYLGIAALVVNTLEVAPIQAVASWAIFGPVTLIHSIAVFVGFVAIFGYKDRKV